MAVDFGSVGGVTVYPNGHFAMSEKSYLRWIDAAQVQDVVASGVYRVHRFDHASAGAPGNKLGLRCSNGNGDVVWAGLRQNFAETAGKATIVWAFRDNQHRILDTTPLSATGQNLGTDRQDGALAVGQTWVDPTQTLRITNLGGGGSSPNEYLDLQVSIVEVPSMEFFTTAGEITRGLTGSYVNANLRGSTDTDWTDGSKTISAARVDNPVKFPTSSWGARAAVGLTGGTDADWDDFSVQWDGYMRVRRKFLLGTISDDSSRMWIDRDGDGTFSAGELVNNNWGNGQGAVLGDLSPVLDPGLYRIRVQYEEGAGGNSFQFETQWQQRSELGGCAAKRRHRRQRGEHAGNHHRGTRVGFVLVESFVREHLGSSRIPRERHRANPHLRRDRLAAQDGHPASGPADAPVAIYQRRFGKRRSRRGLAR